MDCQWVDKNLEAIFSDALAAEESRQARAHIQSCEHCRKEVQALIAIDPVIKKYFQAQLSRALRAGGAPAVSRRGRPAWGVRVAAVAIVAIVLVVLLRTPQVNNGPQPVSVQSQAAPIPSADAPSIVKDDAAVENERTKPSTSGRGGRDSQRAGAPGEGPVSTSSVSAPDANPPAFLVTDPAGYSRSLQDYRGFNVLIGVWSPDQVESVSNLERLYKAFGTNPKFRLIGVSNQRAPKPANTTFPIFFNQGSRLLDTKSGEFVLLNEAGGVRLRGLLAGDFETLSKILREK